MIDASRFNKDSVTDGLIDAVADYLVAVAWADTIRPEVEEIQTWVLSNEVELYEREYPDTSRRKRNAERITENKHVYLAYTEEGKASEEVNLYYDLMDIHLREAGLKPDDMSHDHCPLLVAEHDITKAKWRIMDESAKMLELDMDGRELNSRLLSSGGVKMHQKWVDLNVGLVVNL